MHHRDAVLHAVILLGFSADVAAPEVEDADAGLQLGQNAEVLGRGPGTHDRVVLPMRCFRRVVFFLKQQRHGTQAACLGVMYSQRKLVFKRNVGHGTQAACLGVRFS